MPALSRRAGPRTLRAVPPRPGPSRVSADHEWHLLESQPALVDALRDEILSSGPITFARFMSRALYEPGQGYYAVAAPRPGRDGDFLTAPEAHPLFGRTLAGQIVDCWERLGGPSRFTLREYGAGSGSLAAPLLATLRDEAPETFAALVYQPVEVNPYRLADLHARLEREAGADPLGGGSFVQWGPWMDAPGAAELAAAKTPDVPPAALALSPGSTVAGAAVPETDAITGVVIANEFLDALPVHRVEWQRGQLVEIGVGWRDGWFADEPMPVVTPGLRAYLDRAGLVLFEGQRTEVNLELRPWIEDVARQLERGWVIVIDYGMPAAELYSQRRRQGTLKGTAGHAVEIDPYRRVGRQDLTAHVDLTSLELFARDAGLEPTGTTTQAQFLANLGLGERLVSAQREARSIAEALEARSAARWLLDPRGTGGYRVVVLASAVPREPPLAGLRRAAEGGSA